MQQAEDFRSESTALYGLLDKTDSKTFDEKTLFKDWTINAVLQHLFFWNQMAAYQLTDEAALIGTLKGMTAAGKGMRSFESAHFEGLKGRDLLESWIQDVNRTADLFADADPKARLKWAGPDMSARSSITARLMETWAHGQEVYDHLGVVRRNEDRIQNIVVLGVNTFGWTYKTRKETPPGPMPYLELTAPSGAVWTFGEPNETEHISGLAEEFCQIVTQTRNVADTRLEVTGATAQDWMSKAQCFAGGPEPPPPPGARYTAKRA